MQRPACKTLIFVLVQALSLGLAGAASSGPSGADLQTQCKSAEAMNGGGDFESFAAITAAQCMSFIDGLMSGLQVGALLAPTGRSYCPPKDFTSVDAIAVVQGFLSKYPELTQEEAGVLAADALITAFPCKASK